MSTGYFSYKYFLY
jgi:hypothetical protein